MELLVCISLLYLDKNEILKELLCKHRQICYTNSDNMHINEGVKVWIETWR